jgi:hypothetical protein
MAKKRHINSANEAHDLVVALDKLVEDHERDKMKAAVDDSETPEWVSDVIFLIISFALVWLGYATGKDIYQTGIVHGHFRVMIASGIGALLELGLGLIFMYLSATALLNGDES